MSGTASNIRRPELDLLKILTVFQMIFMHLQENLFSRNFADYRWVSLSGTLFFLDNVCYLTGPFGFMFSMGCTVLFSRHQDAGSCIRRGLKLLLTWFLLNVLRGIPWAFHAAMTSGRTAGEWYLVFLFANDVLFLAGSFFLLFGILRKCRLRLRFIVLIAAVMFLAAQLCGDCGRFLPAWSLRAMCGIVYIQHYSVFPLFNWFAVICAGICWGRALQKHPDPGRLYGIAGFAGAVVSAAALYGLWQAGMLNAVSLRASASDPLASHRVNILSGVCSLGILALLLSIYYGITRIIRHDGFGRWAARISGCILEIYFIHWFGIAAALFYRREFQHPVSGWPIAGTAAGLFAASWALAEGYKHFKSVLFRR